MKGSCVPPKATKTGTTIVGIIFKDGVILGERSLDLWKFWNVFMTDFVVVISGADTRATSGNIVSDKNCEKIHFLAKNM